MSKHRNLVKPQIWKQLTRAHWGKGPAIFKSAYDPDLFSQGSILETLQAARLRIERGKSVNLSLYDRNNICRTASSHSPRANSGLATLLPQECDINLESYLAELSTKEKLEHFTLFLDRPNQHNASIWLTMKAVLAEFYKESMLPIQTVGADIFIGNYKKTPFGVHKDALHNLMFMVLGRRIMHFWPDREVDEQRDETKRVSFEIEPGDLLYWPPEYWHVGESTGETAVSMNIDLWEGDSSQWAKRSVVDALETVANPMAEILAKHSQVPIVGKDYEKIIVDPAESAHDLQQLAKKVVTSLEGPMLELNLSKAWLSQLSSAAMDVPVPRLDFVSIKPNCSYRLRHGAMLPSLSCSGKFLLACNGHVITKSGETGWNDIKAKICTGKTFTPEQLFSPECSISISTICQFLQELRECRGIESAANGAALPSSNSDTEL